MRLTRHDHDMVRAAKNRQLVRLADGREAILLAWRIYGTVAIVDIDKRRYRIPKDDITLIEEEQHDSGSPVGGVVRPSRSGRIPPPPVGFRRVGRVREDNRHHPDDASEPDHTNNLEGGLHGRRKGMT